MLRDLPWDLSGAAADQALAFALQLEPDGARAGAIVALIHRISEAEVPKALSGIMETQLEEDRENALRAVIPRLGPGLLQKALASAPPTKDHDKRTQRQFVFDEALSAGERIARVRDALSVAAATDEGKDRAQRIAACVGAITACDVETQGTLLAECLQQSISLDEDEHFLLALIGVTSQITPSGGTELMQACMQRVSACSSKSVREQAIRAIAAWVYPSMLIGWLNAAARAETEAEHLEQYLRLITVTFQKMSKSRTSSVHRADANSNRKTSGRLLR